MICPACALAPLTHLADLGRVPAACGMTFATAEQARTSPQGTMTLAACPRCGHVANTTFDPALAHFDPSFEAALFHSPTYTEYATGVVDRLVKQSDLAGAHVLEVASGSPVLLDRLTALGCHATGVPSATASGSYDLILARFVLEHMADPHAALVAWRGIATRAFIEVPDAGYDLTTAGWDCIYPHVGYFGESSLRAACTRAGWEIVSVGTAFNGQYLWAELTAASPTTPDPTPVAHNPQFDTATAHWRRTLAGTRPVVWGAGTRGTMFCNRVDPQATLITGVVDRNPAKHHRHLPIAGHQVLSPTHLTTLRPDTVILTNPAYRTEIAEELATLGLSPTIHVA